MSTKLTKTLDTLGTLRKEEEEEEEEEAVEECSFLSFLCDRFSSLIVADNFINQSKVVDHNKQGIITHLDVFALRKRNFKDCPPAIVNCFLEVKHSLNGLYMGVGDKIFVQDKALLEYRVRNILRIVEGGSVYPSFPFGANLDSLQELHLIGEIVQDLKFLKYTPNLRLLYVRPYNDKVVTMDGWEHTTPNFCLPHLLSFMFPTLCPRTPDSVTVMAGWMPNLERISMQMNRNTFPEVCSMWKNTLRKMFVTAGNDMNDFVITGLSSNSMVEQTNNNGDLRRPNITDMKYLETFELLPRCTFVNTEKQDCNFRRLSLTELSFREGFMKVPSLKQLEFHMPQPMERIGDSIATLQARGVRVSAFSWHECIKYFPTKYPDEDFYF